MSGATTAGLVRWGVVLCTLLAASIAAAEPAPAPRLPAGAFARSCLRGFLWRHRGFDGTFRLKKQADAPQERRWSVEPADPLLVACLAQAGDVGGTPTTAEPVLTLRVEIPSRPQQDPWSVFGETSAVTASVDATATGAVGRALVPMVGGWLAAAATGCYEKSMREPGLTEVSDTLAATFGRDSGDGEPALVFARGAVPLTTCVRAEMQDAMKYRVPFFAVHPGGPVWRIEVRVKLSGSPNLFGDAERLQEQANWLATCILDARLEQAGKRQRAGKALPGFGALFPSWGLVEEEGTGVRLPALDLAGQLTVLVRADGTGTQWRAEHLDGFAHCIGAAQQRVTFEPGAARTLQGNLVAGAESANRIGWGSAVRLAGEVRLESPAWPRPKLRVRLALRSAAPPDVASRLRYALGGQARCLAAYVVPGDTAPLRWTLTVDLGTQGALTEAVAVPDTASARHCLLGPLMALQTLPLQAVPATWVGDVGLEVLTGAGVAAEPEDDPGYLPARRGTML